MEGRFLDEANKRKTALKETDALPVWSESSDVDLNLIFDVDDTAAFASCMWGVLRRGPCTGQEIPPQKRS